MEHEQKCEFQIGQRVVAAVDHPAMNKSLREGAAGIVRVINADQSLDVGVEWDDEICGGHGLEDSHDVGHCEPGHGWFVRSWEIAPIQYDADDTEIEVDEDLRSLIGL